MAMQLAGHRFTIGAHCDRGILIQCWILQNPKVWETKKLESFIWRLTPATSPLKKFTLISTSSLYLVVLITGRKRSFGKVTFSQVFVCPQGRGVCPSKLHWSHGNLHAPEMAIKAGGTHPTGMHTCLVNVDFWCSSIMLPHVSPLITSHLLSELPI